MKGGGNEFSGCWGGVKFGLGGTNGGDLTQNEPWKGK